MDLESNAVILGQLPCLCISFLTFNTGIIVVLPIVVVKIKYNDCEVLEW